MNPEESHWISALLRLAFPPLKCINAHVNSCSAISKAGLLLYSWSQLYHPEAAWWFGNPNQTEHVLTVAPADFESSCGGQLAWRKLGPCRWISPIWVPPWYLQVSSVSLLWLGACPWHPADVPGPLSSLLTCVRTLCSDKSLPLDNPSPQCLGHQPWGESVF